MKRVSFIILSIFLMFTLVSCSEHPDASQDMPAHDSPSTSTQESSIESNNTKETNDTRKTKDNIVEKVSQNQETQSEALNLYEKGLKLYYERKFNEALNLFNQVLAIEPQNYQALNGKGATYAFQGRYNEGIKLIQQSIQLKPDFVYAHFNLGLAYELAGNYEESIKAYQRALELDDKDVWSFYGIASIYGRKGDVEKVIEWLRPAIALEPEVKAVAREEKDFNPVKNDPRFISLVKAE